MHQGWSIPSILHTSCECECDGCGCYTRGAFHSLKRLATVRANVFFLLNDWCVYAMSTWRRPEMKMARTIRSFFFNFVFAAIVLFLTSCHQLINFVVPNLHYHPPKIQCNYACDKEIIP